MNDSLRTSDTLPLVGLLATIFSPQNVTVAVGVVTIAYTILKAIHLVKNWSKAPRKDD